MQHAQNEDSVEPIKPRHEATMNLGDAGAAASESEAADALGNFAADLGTFLGTVQTRAMGWMDQRKAIADQLTQIRDTANQYLEQLTGSAQSAVAVVARRRGRPAGGGAQARGGAAAGGRKGGRRKGFRMSEEARQRIAEAQRKRWAKHRREEAK